MPTTPSSTTPSSGFRLVLVVCAAQIFVQLGAGFWPALLPQMMQLWQLSNSEAGWITASFFGAYMVAVPVLLRRGEFTIERLEEQILDEGPEKEASA